MLGDVEKTLADFTFKRIIRYGRVEVTYWDDTVVCYIGDKGTDEQLLRVRLKDPRIIRQMAVNASLAVGEAYMSGRLEIDEKVLSQFFKLVAMNSPRSNRRQLRLRARNRKSNQQKNIVHHYDVGNDYYRLWLDKSMMYSCAYFKDANDSLEQAQRQKIVHLLRKARLDERKGLRMLDIGCGWGHLLVTAAQLYGIKGLGITLSKEQLKGARELAECEGVSHLVQFELLNYQDLKGKRFDRIISVGMLEHVGRGNYDQYFSAVNDLLVPGGVSVLHTITQLQPRATDAWVDKYVFPGGYLPTVAELQNELARQSFWLVDFEDLAQHYAMTLRHWRERHQAHKEKIIQMFDNQFPDMTGLEFYRLRDLWLAGSAAGLGWGKLGLAQFVFTKGKLQNGPLTRKYLYPCDERIA